MSVLIPKPAPSPSEAGSRGPETDGRRYRRRRSLSSVLASREAAIWITGGALIVCVVMIVALLSGILFTGLSTFWPQEIVRFETVDGRVYMGPVTREEIYLPDPEAYEELQEIRRANGESTSPERRELGRSLVRTGNFKLTQSHFEWVEHELVRERSNPEWATGVERLEWGRFYGFPEAFVLVEELEHRTPDGFARPADELRAEADERIAELVAAAELDGEPGYLVEVFEAGDSRLLPVAQSDLTGDEQIRGAVLMARGPEVALAHFGEHHDRVLEQWEERRWLEKHATGEVNRVLEAARLEQREAELEYEDARKRGGRTSQEAVAALARLDEATRVYKEERDWGESEFERIRGEIDAINRSNDRYQLLFRTAGEGTLPPASTLMELDEIVRTLPTNRMTWADEFSVYLSRWWEFLWADPREANSEGGIYPAIFGTVLMTMIMAILVVPFGVLAALYLREYARNGPVVSAVRIAVNNLAGVPSIVFGIFGLGFFCYTVGSSVDELFFRAELPNPTFGKGGLIWASLTLALLTLPVVIVATEEALAAVPNSAREGSYACGAGKWQTIRRIILPRAMPGIMTGMILAMARGAGEVAPLMLVGAVKLAPELPIDGYFPFIHPQNSFMHLGFHIFDVGFQSQNSEAAKPMVYTTTLVLIALIFSLNLVAIALRKRLARRFESSQI